MNGKIGSCSNDGSIRIWDLGYNTCSCILDYHFIVEPDTIKKNVAIYSILELNDGRIVSTMSNKQIIFWNVNAKKHEKVLTGHTDKVYLICHMADGRLASTSFDKSVRVWNITSGA